MSRSTGNHSFASVPSANIQRSTFNRSSTIKTTFAGGDLNPVFVDEVLPGDTFNCKMHNFTRMSTPLVPIMDDLYLESFFFFVPNRLVWDNWQKFNGEQTDPGDSTDFTVPQVDTEGNGFAFNGLFDLMGIPPDIGGSVNALHARGYLLIWNEFFRDQNLQDSMPLNTTDTSDTESDFPILKRGKRHDYFTSALPWPQKGPAVSLPMSGNAPVITDGSPIMWSFGAGNGNQSEVEIQSDHLTTETGTPTGNAQFGPSNAAGNFGAGLIANLEDATGATINALRQAFQIQKLYERDARGGSRYTEILRSHFGVVSPDQRLQRPEYLGGGSQKIEFNSVSQTRSAGETNLGDQGAYATSSGGSHSFTKSFTEHGIIIGLVSVRAKLTYQAGLDRMWTRQTRWDYYWPALAHIGEQTILNKEINWTGVPGDDDDDGVFGYQERYAEYRYKPGRICGAFRSLHSNSLDQWHLSQDFLETTPTLNASFIEDNPPVDRILAVQADPNQFLFDGFFDLTCSRPMPTYGVPGMIDHF